MNLGLVTNHKVNQAWVIDYFSVIFREKLCSER